MAIEMQAIKIRKEVSETAHTAYLRSASSLVPVPDDPSIDGQFEDRRKSIWGNIIFFNLLTV